MLDCNKIVFWLELGRLIIGGSQKITKAVLRALSRLVFYFIRLGLPLSNCHIFYINCIWNESSVLHIEQSSHLYSLSKVLFLRFLIEAKPYRTIFV